jgi:hypothetical protein
VVLAHGFYLSLTEWAVLWDALLDLGCHGREVPVLLGVSPTSP